LNREDLNDVQMDISGDLIDNILHLEACSFRLLLPQVCQSSIRSFCSPSPSKEFLSPPFIEMMIGNGILFLIAVVMIGIGR